MITQLLPKPTSRYSDRQPNPDKPELTIQSFEDRENSPIKFFATKCTKIITKVLKKRMGQKS